jgi:hypothetical protein
MAFAVRIKQNDKLITEKSLVGLAVSQYDADTVEFVHLHHIFLNSSTSLLDTKVMYLDFATRPLQQSSGT